MREALLAAYRRHGYEIRAGEMVTRHLRDGMTRESVLSECASAWKDGKRLDTGYGLSWQELSVLEFLASIWTPDAIFGIGNGFGWSAVAMRLLWPEAWLAVIDDHSEGTDGAYGRSLASDILGELGGGYVRCGKSPENVTVRLVSAPPLDLVLIDGQHTGEAQLADYRAVRPFLAPGHVILFHDVLYCRMEASFMEIAEDYPGCARILRRTTTGMGIVWAGGAGRRCAEVFGG